MYKFSRRTALLFALLFGASSAFTACADGDSGDKTALVAEDNGDDKGSDDDDDDDDDDEVKDDADDDDDMPVNDDDPSDPEDPEAEVCPDRYRYTQWHSPALRQNHNPATFPLEACAPDGII